MRTRICSVITDQEHLAATHLFIRVSHSRNDWTGFRSVLIASMHVTNVSKVWAEVTYNLDKLFLAIHCRFLAFTKKNLKIFTLRDFGILLESDEFVYIKIEISTFKIEQPIG